MLIRRPHSCNKKALIECSYCNGELRKADAAKIELLFIGRRSKNIVHTIKYFHPLHYNNMMSSMSREIYERHASDLQLETEKFKILGPHLTRADRERLALGGLVFHKLIMTLNMGLDDALHSQASIKIKIRPARGYILYNKWMLTKC